MSFLKNWNLIKKSLGLSNEGLILVAVGLVVVVVVALMSPTISVMSGKKIAMSSNAVGEEEQVYVSAEETYKDFECSCCGKSVADCGCGMAKEIKAYVRGLVDGGLSKKSIYKAMVKKHTVDILFDEALAAEIKDELIAEAPVDRPILEITPESIDAGEVSMAKGKVEKVFQVRNSGQSELIITGMESSCMCTSALLRNDGKESPVFGMHDNPTGWSTIIRPGGEAELVVIYDPNAHGPDAVGPVTRTVTVNSNDVIDSAKKIRFEALVVK